MIPQAEPVDGSRLCLACGLCCQGLLHDWARLRDDEVEAAQRLGLHTETQQGRPAFALPCPCHRDDRCTIYQERLSPCSEYRCKLLRGYLDGRAGWEESLRRVELAKQLIAAIRGRIGPAQPGVSLWQQLRTLDIPDPELRLDMAALLIHCQKHFWMQAEPA